LFKNNPKVSDVLERGGTVVVPNRQRAVAMRLAHTRAQLERKLSHWPSCDVLPWTAWLERTAASGRHTVLCGRRRLGAAEEWLAWRAAAVEATEGAGMLMPSSLADALRQSAARVRDGALRWQGTPTSESALLARVMAIMTRVCQQRGALLSDDWMPLLAELPASRTPLLFAGFEEMGRALKARLRDLGAAFDDTAEEAPAAVRADLLVAASDRHDELRRAAQWCRAILERKPDARLLVMVPRLGQCRAMATQAFDHALCGTALFDGHPTREPYAIEGGVPLGDYPLVGAALALLALGAGGLEFAELAAVLRGNFLRCGTQAARAALELRLRDRNVLRADAAQLLGAARAGATEGPEELAAALSALLPELARDGAAREHAGGWARRFAAQLQLWGWPGAQALASAEQQQRERFETLLGEFATLGPASGRLSASAAVELLRTMAARTRFEPATDDVAVTLCASSGDPLVHYDGIWVTGLNAEQWPAPAQADPFIPIGVQRAAQIQSASPEGQLALAKARMAAWRGRAGTLVLSWPCLEDDVRLQPSSLMSVPPEAVYEAPAPLPDPLIASLRASARLEARPPERALNWPLQRALPRGTRALELQAACPFRALAELRLDAAPLSEPRPGLDLRERGRVLHRALELVWRQLDGLLALRACEPLALQALVRKASAQALTQILAPRLTPLEPALLANETARTSALIGALLEQEKARAEFHIHELEESGVHTLAGAQIRVRMDRVDRLGDERLAVIDYKSGAPQNFGVDDERPEQVQLLIYAALIGAPLAAIAGVHLLPAGIRWRGAAADASVFPALNARRGTAPPWAQVLPYAQQRVAALVSAFVNGEAQVAPGPRACERCHLAGLCRIDNAHLALEETAVEAPGADDDA
jgi:ATP-dependent helicase/nuclease subunit B